MTNHPNRKRRVWQTDSGTVCLRVADCFGEERVREFWVPGNSGYVHEISEQRPGTLGPQVCTFLSYRGPTLYCSADSLLDEIRREYRRARAADKRWAGY